MQLRGAKLFLTRRQSLRTEHCHKPVQSTQNIFCFCKSHFTESVGWILKFLDSNLGRDTSYFKNFRSFAHCPQGTCQNITLNYPTAVSLHMLSKYSFNYHPVIRRYIIWLVTASKNNPQKIILYIWD